MDKRIKDKTGNVYGRLTVIGFDHRDKKHSYWKCKCECGNECIKRSDTLNDKSSCGCFNNVNDLRGKIYGRLKVIEFSYCKNELSYWKCKCECGNECIVRRDCLCNGSTKSCGCLLKEHGIELGNQYGNVYKDNLVEKANYKHGDSKTRFYHIFIEMKRRCNNEKRSCYSNYGGRGIKVEWESYEDFKKDMYDSYLKHSEKYGEENTTIDRIDVNGNYCKSNCKWSTNKEQNRNKRNTIFVILEDSSEIPLITFCEENNYNYDTLKDRYYNSEYKNINKIPVKKLLKIDDDIV